MKFRTVAAAALLAVGTGQAMAASVTLSGATFDLTYDSALVGLFGTPTIVGDIVEWFPSGSPGFTAQTDFGFGVTNSTFALKVTAKDGFTLSSFTLAEGGDYFFFSDPVGKSQVGVSGQLRVTPLPGVTTSTPIVASAPFVANSFGDFATTDWAAFTAPVIVDTKMANVTVQNILNSYVSKTADGYAFIEKKEAFLVVGVTPVPEPETYAMMLAGLCTLGFLARRRRGA
jgi:hypothetical protein